MSREENESNRTMRALSKKIVGWDIGAANVKAAWISPKQGPEQQVRVASQPFEIWREKERLPEVLKEVFAAISAGFKPDAMAITTTAELSDVFATKREGILFVFESVQKCLPDIPCQAFSLTGKFVPLDEASVQPLDFAAANWLASAQWIARTFPDCILVDVGSTTTDILPIVKGEVATGGSTDMARMILGELVFTGALRTNLAAIVQTVPISGQMCRVASEYFAISGDVHLILGNLHPRDYRCSTPDGQSPSLESARRRLARIVCADMEMLSISEIEEIARFVYDRQLQQICDGLNQVISRIPLLRHYPVINVGVGSFLGRMAAGRLNLEIIDLENKWSPEEIAVTPYVAVARLLAEAPEAGPR